MKLQDPEIEREFLRLAEQGRNGKPMERRDKHVWRTILPRLFYMSLFVVLLLTMLGLSSPGHRAAHWQFAICGVVLTAAALSGISIALKPIHRPGCLAALINLPVKWSVLFRTIRNRFLLRSLFWLGGLSFIFAFAVSGFSFSSPWLTGLSTILLTGTTLATVAISYDPPAALRHARTFWISLGLLLTVGMMVFFYNGSGYFKTGGTPQWLACGVSMLTWFFPPTWALPGRMEQGGGLLALVWCFWGFLKWGKWPEAIGRYFDAPQNFFETINDPETEDEEIFPEESHDSGEVDSTQTSLAFPGEGWMEHWVRRVIGEKDALIAGTLVDQNTTWTKQTNLAIIIAPILLLISWVITRIPGNFYGYEALKLSVTLVSHLAVPLLLLPFSNAVPRASGQWGEGPQALPFLSLLPISARDLSRVSTKITLARSLVLAAIATPYFLLLLSIVETDIPPSDALWIVPYFCCFWVASRPLLVWFRLQSAGRCRRGMFPMDYLWVWLVIALAITWLVAGAVGMIFGLMWKESVNSADDYGFMAGMAFGGLLLSGLCARATFEIHHWRMRRGHFDWVSEN
ncbi:hypothetical protein JIN84_14460 [Luteolibacter yonseiensis]|uniref:Uncharacterized protein n=1 Tax=Luteolibacter yonseiensis TaxID=1144680 RepID=A0A934R4L7_9BACT|nr:hypothetical protein [Luteolibacter yonseiensis]MBK1816824.1 hypothetical protein [Luteolibacter yonseiensis]